ncbi:MAG TPA: LamG domain-containing protein, partial [Candidatus Nanoarchaeia archaeon]|nr:LamG domain-containing protein [Candidatus Nanoarchaeia archaeon]
MRGQGLFKLTLIVSTFIIAVFFSGVSKPAMLNVLPSVNVVNDYLVSLLMNNIDAQISTILSEGAKPFGEISTEVSDDLLIVTPACTRYVNYSVIESYDTVIINPAWNETRLDNGSPVVIIHDAITQQVPIYRNVSMLEQWNCDTGIYADVSAEWTDDSKTNITININNYNVKDSSLLNKTLITKIVDKYNSKNKTLDTDMFTLINESKTKKINLRKEDVIGNELHLGENSAVYLINTTTQWNISNGLIKVVSLADTYNLQLWGYNGTEWINVGFLQPNPNNDNLGSAIITILENTPSKVILNITKGNIGYNLTLNGGAPYFSLINNTPQTTAYYLVKNYDIDNLSVYIKNSTTINFPLSSNINFAVSGSYYTLLFDAVKNYTTFFVVNKEHTDGTSDILIATTGEVYEKWTYQPTVTAVSFGVLMNINTSTQSGNTASNYSWDSWNVLGTAPTDYALYYNMNEGAGTTLDNKQGNNSLDGTLANTTAWKQSKKSHGLNTNIKNGWVTNANLGGWANGKSELSFAIWFKYTALQADKNIIGWWATNQANIKASGTSLTYQISTAGGIKSAVSGDVNDGNWHLAVGTYDGSYVRLFIDGVMSQETAQTGSIVSAGSDNFNVGVIVGSETFAFKGELDEAYVFDRNLTMQEIQGL